MAGKPGCGGKKGRSGPLPKNIAKLRNETILKAWEVTNKALSEVKKDDPDFKPEEVLKYEKKVDIAEKIAGKDLGRKLEHTGDVVEQTRIIILRDTPKVKEEVKVNGGREILLDTKAE